MKTVPDSPPADPGARAFPVPPHTGEGGMSLRTYIATAAMQGMLANREYSGLDSLLIAKYAAGYADLLILQLNQPQ